MFRQIFFFGGIQKSFDGYIEVHCGEKKFDLNISLFKKLTWLDFKFSRNFKSHVV